MIRASHQVVGIFRIINMSDMLASSAKRCDNWRKP